LFDLDCGRDLPLLMVARRKSKRAVRNLTGETMLIRYESCPDRAEYQSLLVLNDKARWRETLYFNFFTPWGEEEERLFAGRAMSDVHFKDKPCLCVLVFDFHRWDAATVERALELELPAVAFERPLGELLKRALEEREANPEGFVFTNGR